LEWLLANSSHENILLVGIAGLVAGAMSMAAGEYVSVSSQSETEKADLAIEKKSIEQDIEYEKNELALIYQDRGLEPFLAKQVADQLTAHDALGAHARDDIGISEVNNANPVQAAFFSAGAFSLGAALPLLVTYFVTGSQLVFFIAASCLVSLALLGAVAARAGGASIVVGAARATFWGAFAMVLTALVGRAFGVAA